MDEKTLYSQTVYDGQLIKVRVDTVQTNSGTATREIVEHNPAVAVIALDKGDFIMVRQYRKSVEQELIEIVAGGIDHDEIPQVAAQRELREEIGFRAGKITKLGAFYLSPGYCSEYIHLFLAEELVADKTWAEDTYEITPVRFSAKTISEMIAAGQIKDGKTLAAFTLYQAYLKLRR